MSRPTKDHPALQLLADSLRMTQGPAEPDTIAGLLGHALEATGYELVPKVRAAGGAASDPVRLVFRGYEGRLSAELTLTDERGREQTFDVPLTADYTDGVPRFVPDVLAVNDELFAAIDAGTFGWRGAGSPEPSEPDIQTGLGG